MSLQSNSCFGSLVVACVVDVVVVGDSVENIGEDVCPLVGAELFALLLSLELGAAGLTVDKNKAFPSLFVTEDSIFEPYVVWVKGLIFGSEYSANGAPDVPLDVEILPPGVLGFSSLVLCSLGFSLPKAWSDFNAVVFALEFPPMPMRISSLVAEYPLHKTLTNIVE